MNDGPLSLKTMRRICLEFADRCLSNKNESRNVSLLLRSRCELKITGTSEPVPRCRGTAWARGLVNRCSQCAHFPAASFSFEIWRPSWSDQLCRQKKRWISPDIVHLIGDTWLWREYFANCFHKRNWEVVKSPVLVGMVYRCEENTRRFVREIFAGYGNPHSSILWPWRKPAPQSKVSWFYSLLLPHSPYCWSKNVRYKWWWLSRVYSVCSHAFALWSMQAMTAHCWVPLAFAEWFISGQSILAAVNVEHENFHSSIKRV